MRETFRTTVWRNSHSVDDFVNAAIASRTIDPAVLGVGTSGQSLCLDQLDGSHVNTREIAWAFFCDAYRRNLTTMTVDLSTSGVLRLTALHEDDVVRRGTHLSGAAGGELRALYYQACFKQGCKLPLEHVGWVNAHPDEMRFVRRIVPDVVLERGAEHFCATALIEQLTQLEGHELALLASLNFPRGTPLTSARAAATAIAA